MMFMILLPINIQLPNYYTKKKIVQYKLHGMRKYFPLTV